MGAPSGALNRKPVQSPANRCQRVLWREVIAMRFVSISARFRCCECGQHVQRGPMWAHHDEVFCSPDCAVSDPCKSARDRQFSKLERADLASKLVKAGVLCQA
jgi:hypothetical protein